MSVVIERGSYTPRIKPLSGRLDIYMKFSGEVPDNFSLLIGNSITEKIPSYDELVKEYLKFVDDDLNRAEGFISRLRFSRSRAQGREFEKLKGQPIILGTALKGSIRARMEYKFRPFPKGSTFSSFSCYVLENRYFRPNPRLEAVWGKEVSGRRGACSPPNVCIVCDMFGTAGLSSRMNFGNAVPVEYKLKWNEGFEVVLPGSRFEFEIWGFNLSLWELGLLFYTMELYSGKSILIGSLKYRYNPKTTGNMLGGKYFVGLLRLKLEEFRAFRGDAPDDVQELLKRAEEQFRSSSYWEGFVPEAGVID